MEQVNTDTIIIEEPVLSEDEEKVRIYGATTTKSPSHAKTRPDDVQVSITKFG